MSPNAAQIPLRGVGASKRRGRSIFVPLLAVTGALFVAVLALAGLGSMRQLDPGLASSQSSSAKFVPRPLFSFHGPSNPGGLAVSRDGQHVYVAEAGGERLIKDFDRDGREASAAKPPETDRTSRWPTRITVDPEGRIYVVDRTRFVVDIYTPDLRWQQAWRPPAAVTRDGWQPSGVAAGLNGRLYVTQTEGSDPSVLVFDRAGKLVDRLSGGMGLGAALRSPSQAVADNEGRVYIADGEPGRLVVVGIHGKTHIVERIANKDINPRGLAVGRGLLYVADAASQQVLVLSLDDQPAYLGAFGEADGGDKLGFPSAIGISATGRVYVADWLNHRVQVYGY